jgi:alpha-ketoglutarate-dependent taurine dioxygenase
MIKTGLLDPKRNLPFVVEAEKTNGEVYDVHRLIAWYKENEAFIDEKLLQHGAVLFRGFGISTPGAFAKFTRSISSCLLESMEENVPRTKLSSGVYTSTEYPPEYMLSMHSEYSYSNRWPGKLFFCSVTAAKQGGETPLADNREVLRDLDPRIVEEFGRKQVKYLRNLHNGQGFGLSWQTAFQTTDKSVVEDYCREKSVEFEWKSDGGLRLSQTLAGIITHSKTGDKVWFNQAPQFHASDYPEEIYQSVLSAYKNEDELPQNVCFGDGSPVSVEDLRTVRETMHKKAVVFPWQEGDVVVLDNVLVSHGRMPFVGPRKTLVAMAEK